MKCSHYFVLVVPYEKSQNVIYQCLMLIYWRLAANQIDNLSSSIFNKSDDSSRLVCSIKMLVSSAKKIEISFSDAFGKLLM